MPSELNASTFVPPSKEANDGHEFEWLLCFASTFQAFRCELPVELKATKQQSRPKNLVTATRGGTRLAPGNLICRPLSLWREIRSKYRGAA
jgi:hypothetical protein